MSLKLTYQYQMVLSLANREVGIGKIGKEIEVSVREFNIRSKAAKNAKQIIKCEIREDENLLYIWLNSNNKMGSPIRGLFLLSKLIIEQLSSQGKEEKTLLKDIIRNKCLFKVVEEPYEVKNLKLEKPENLKAQETKNIKLENDKVQKNNIKLSLVEAEKLIIEIFFEKETNSYRKEKAKEEILKAVERYLENKEEQDRRFLLWNQKKF